MTVVLKILLTLMTIFGFAAVVSLTCSFVFLEVWHPFVDGILAMASRVAIVVVGFFAALFFFGQD